MELLLEEGLRTLNAKNQIFAKKAVNNSTFKAHSNPLFSKLKVFNLEDTYKLSVLMFMHGYFNDNLPSSFQNIFQSLAEPNLTKQYKLERVLNKNLENFPSAAHCFLNCGMRLKLTLKKLNLQKRVINICIKNLF